MRFYNYGFLISLSICLVGVGSLLVGCQQATMRKQVVPAEVPAGVVPTQIMHTSKGYQLVRGGQPYYIKGVAGLQQLDRVRTLGGNSVRLYTTNYADLLLNQAQDQGLTVMLGLWMEPQTSGFDYYDRQAVAQQRETIRQQVLRFRRHPALLMWNVGNELDFNTLNSRSFQVLGEIVRMIHELDPYHPVTTSVTDDLHMMPALKHFCANLDVLSVNSFAPVNSLATRLKAAGWEGPYIVSEFGATGWWEVPKTKWAAPCEQTSSAKAETILIRFQQNARSGAGHFLGSYVLYWGQRFEQTPMWFSLFTRDGEKTAVVDAMHYLWTGQPIADKAPVIGKVQLAGKGPEANTYLRPGVAYPARVRAYDPEADSLRAEWQVTRDVNERIISPQRRTAPELIIGAVSQTHGLEALVQAPQQPGPYRLLVTVHDQHGSVATHSFPFYVRP